MCGLPQRRVVAIARPPTDIATRWRQTHGQTDRQQHRLQPVQLSWRQLTEDSCCVGSYWHGG